MVQKSDVAQLVGGTIELLSPREITFYPGSLSSGRIVISPESASYKSVRRALKALLKTQNEIHAHIMKREVVINSGMHEVCFWVEVLSCPEGDIDFHVDVKVRGKLVSVRINYFNTFTPKN